MTATHVPETPGRRARRAGGTLYTACGRRVARVDGLRGPGEVEQDAVVRNPHASYTPTCLTCARALTAARNALG